MDTVVHVEGLRKLYGATVAVDDVSFEVRAGEIFGMVGPNGAGKTTTCLLYTSDAADERSSVDLGGRRIIKKKKSKRTSLSRQTKVTIKYK